MHCSSRSILHSRSRLLISLHCLGVAALCLSSVYAGRSPINLDALRRDGYGVVPVNQPRPNDLAVRGTINGRNATLVLDTGWGAEGISLDSNYARSLKLVTEGAKRFGHSATGAIMSVEKATAGAVVLGNVQLTGVPLLVGTFKGLRHEQVREFVWASGFVGAGFLHTNSAVLDLPNFRLYLRPPGKGRLAVIGPALRAVGFSEVPFELANNQCLVDVEINGVGGKMIVDTGATLSVLDTRFASQIKVRGYQAEISGIDAAGIVNRSRVGTTGSLKIGGIPARAPEMTLDTCGFYTHSGGKIIGLLGMDVLGQNWGIIDFGNRKLYFSGAK
jgi:predicted aspartyl protease